MQLLKIINDMKKLIQISALLIAIFATSSIYAQKSNKIQLTLTPGVYSFNSTDLYFFDDGINCYLKHICRDVDTVFDNSAQKLTISKDSVIKFQSYLFTDTYEYVYTSIGKVNGWIRVSIPINEQQKDFLKVFLKSPNYELYSSYVQVIPFKNVDKVFISTTDDWYICDLTNFKTSKIGTKGGRLQDCQMIYSKDCVKCSIVMGWEEDVIYNDEGKKIK